LLGFGHEHGPGHGWNGWWSPWTGHAAREPKCTHFASAHTAAIRCGGQWIWIGIWSKQATAAEERQHTDAAGGYHAQAAGFQSSQLRGGALPAAVQLGTLRRGAKKTTSNPTSTHAHQSIPPSSTATTITASLTKSQ